MESNAHDLEKEPCITTTPATPTTIGISENMQIKRKRAHLQNTLFSSHGFTKLPRCSKPIAKDMVPVVIGGSQDANYNKGEMAADLEKEQRRRLWKEAWTMSFEWAYFDIEQARFFSKYCKNDNTCKSEFGRAGSIIIQHNALTEHSKTRVHKVAKDLCSVLKASIEDCMNRSRATVDDAIRNLFGDVYSIAKNDLSFMTYPVMLKMLQFCKCPTISRELYQGDKACKTFVNFISEALLRQIVKKIQNSEFYSLMLDESTDVGKTQHLIVYASFIEDNQPKTCFLGLLEMQGSTSTQLYDSLKCFLSELNLKVENLVCLGIDGAACMMGKVNGLATRMKKLNPFMTSIHCLAHRTTLCLADAIKKSAFAQEIDNIVNEIAHIFSKSALHTSSLKQLQEGICCQPLTVSHIHKVRWLSRSQAIHKVCESYEPLLVYLKEHNLVLYHKLVELKMIYSIFFMDDILERLATLNKTFQADFIDISCVISLIETEIRLLTSQFIDDPEVDINARIFDEHGHHIIPDYGPIDGQLVALRTSIRGVHKLD